MENGIGMTMNKARVDRLTVHTLDADQLTDEEYAKAVIDRWDDYSTVQKVKALRSCRAEAKAMILRMLGGDGGSRLAQFYDEIRERDFVEVTGVSAVHVKFSMEMIACASLMDGLVNKMRDEWRDCGMQGKSRYRMFEATLKGIYHARTDIVKKCFNMEETVVSVISRVLPFKFYEYLYTKNGGTQMSGTLYYSYQSEVQKRGYRHITHLRKACRKAIENAVSKEGNHITMGSFIATIYIIAQFAQRMADMDIDIAKTNFIDNGISPKAKGIALKKLLKVDGFKHAANECKGALLWLYGAKGWQTIEPRLRELGDVLFELMDGKIIPLSSYMTSITKTAASYVDFYLARIILQVRNNEKPSPKVREDILFLMEMKTAWMLLCKDIKWLAANTVSEDVQDLIDEVHEVIGEGKPVYDESGMVMDDKKLRCCSNYKTIRNRAYNCAIFYPNRNITDRFNRRMFEESEFCKGQRSKG